MDGDGHGDEGGQRHAAPEGDAHGHALREGVDGHHHDHQQHLPPAGAPHGLENDLLLFPPAQVTLGRQDEEDAKQPAHHRLDPAVAGPLGHQPEARTQHEAGGHGVGVGHGPIRDAPDEEEGDGAQTRGQRRAKREHEDQRDIVHSRALARRTTIPMATSVTRAMLVCPACRYDSGSSSTSRR